MLKKLWFFLDGKKSYSIALLTALDGLWQYYVQHGSNFHTFVVYLLFGGGLAALRNAVSKV